MLKAFALLFCLAAPLAAQPAPPNSTYCNPLDIDYKYNFEQLNEGISYRSGADPVIVLHKGEYYLFVTISGGWWHSSDLKNWSYVTPDKWPFEDMCAPAALSAEGRLLLFQSTFEQRPILELADPKQGKIEFFNRWLPRMKGAEGPWDPSIFHDPDSDRWFMYFGSSNTYPLYGIELDRSKNLSYKGAPQGLIRLHPEQHGWERFGQDHRETITPFTEGAWMTKHQGKYYLQYGAPGTEYNVYATGTYVGDDPMGPFTYADYNPVAYKPGGFACGAGHGNTFQDRHGNYWLTGTCWIGVNWGMERRIVMVPAGFDKDGQMYANTRFGDFPQRLPDHKLAAGEDTFTGWMLLSHRKPVVASSQLNEGGPRGRRVAPPRSKDDHPSSNLSDESLRTSWVAEHNQPGQTLTMDLGRSSEVRAVQIDYADYKSGIFRNDERVYTEFSIEGSEDGKTWRTLADLKQQPRRDRACAYLELAAPAAVRYVRYVHGYVAAKHLAIAEMRVFGKAPGAAPAAPLEVKATRDKDRRNAFVSWKPVAGATGYNVRWGLAPDKIYQTYQVWADQKLPLEVRALNIAPGYSFQVEAFNESGVSAGSKVVQTP